MDQSIEQPISVRTNHKGVKPSIQIEPNSNGMGTPAPCSVAEAIVKLLESVGVRYAFGVSYQFAF